MGENTWSFVTRCAASISAEGAQAERSLVQKTRMGTELVYCHYDEPGWGAVAVTRNVRVHVASIVCLLTFSLVPMPLPMSRPATLPKEAES